MLTLTHHISIGAGEASFRLRRLLDLQISKDIHALGDQATLTLSAERQNQSLQLEEQVPPGSSIRIAIGYDNDNKTEFEGYVTQIEKKKEKLVVHCLDTLYLYERDVPARTYSADGGPHTLQTILEDLAKDVQLREVVLAPGLQAFRYPTFQRAAGPAMHILKKIKEDLGILIYMRGKILFASGPHSSDAETEGAHVRYRLDSNVLSSELVYRRASDRRLRVRVKSRAASDEPLEVIASGNPEAPDFQVKEPKPKPPKSGAGAEGAPKNGAEDSSAPAPEASDGGARNVETIELLRYHIQEVAQLKEIAQKELTRWSYDGYEGHISTWLQPYCSYGYHAVLEDRQHRERSATFFVEKVEVRFSEQGGTRKVYLGKRILSNPTNS